MKCYTKLGQPNSLFTQRCGANHTRNSSLTTYENKYWAGVSGGRPKNNYVGIKKQRSCIFFFFLIIREVAFY